MKDRIKQYLDREISRRSLLSGLGAFGIPSMAANSMAHFLAPFVAEAGEPAATADLPPWRARVRDSGGALLIAPLKAVGVKYLFFHPSSPSATIYDAWVDTPEIQPILALQEGALAAMADGYAYPAIRN